MNNTGLILVLAYPETIVMVADEWYSRFLHYVGVGKKNYVRAGHAALVLINKATGELEYHDFGRYITSEPNGRVRGKDTDHELNFPLKAVFNNGKLANLDELLVFLSTNPKLTHGDGKLIASVNETVDYEKAKAHIKKMQGRDFIRYAAFIQDACNCARFVTDSLIQGVTDKKVRQSLKRSKWFTPSTTGNVVRAATNKKVYEISESGIIKPFTSTVWQDNKIQFLDRLKDHTPNFTGTLHPKENDVREAHAQWLSGIAAGAWYELYHIESLQQYRMRRVSPYGNIDTNERYLPDQLFEITKPYEFVHYSNCLFFHVRQEERIIRFDLVASD